MQRIYGRAQFWEWRGATMEKQRIAWLRTHQKNIDRYERLLGTKLTAIEQRFIEQRISEERSAMVMLQAEATSCYAA